MICELATRHEFKFCNKQKPGIQVEKSEGARLLSSESQTMPHLPLITEETIFVRKIFRGRMVECIDKNNACINFLY